MFRFAVGMAAVAMAATDVQWEQYKKDFKKVYVNEAEEEERHAIFTESVTRIEKLNAMGSAVFGLTWTSDLKEHEKNAKGFRRPSQSAPHAMMYEHAPIYAKKHGHRHPKYINWRGTAAVTPIKNQGQCGSCWAFSATSAIESQLALVGGEDYSIELSPQQINSCTPSDGEFGCFGCDGGYTEGAYMYVNSVFGLANSFYIPYEQSLTEVEKTKSCPSEKIANMSGPKARLMGGHATVSGFSYAMPPCFLGDCEDQDLHSLAAALEETPVAICVNAAVWNDYKGGVMTAKQCGNFSAAAQDHCVMATGFNKHAPIPYWIVRNSWASTWGESGYIYLEMAENTCGLANDATIPTVKLGLSSEQKAKAVGSRERMYAYATMQDLRVV